MFRLLSLLGVLLLVACTPQGSPQRPDSHASRSSVSSASSSALSSAEGVTSASSDSSVSGINKTSLPLDVPNGFSVEVFADGLPDARVIVQDGFGNFWVSRPDAGAVTLLTMSGGQVIHHDDILTGLNRPHGLAIDPQNGLDLYIAEEHQITKVRLYSDGEREHVIDLPPGGRHWTRTIAFGPDDRLYVSIGSTCDVCTEGDDRHAAIYSLRRDGSDFTQVAEGLRNAVFFTWSSVDGRMWATEMGRDHLGDDLPPDEINVIEQQAHYGWPWCYGDRVRDKQFRPGESFHCSETHPAAVELQAHVAPLGLAFVPEEGWPEDMWYDLLVAEHGSWNRSEPVGYKLARVPLGPHGEREGPVKDFVSGWLTEDGRKLGRPVDLLIRPGGVLYVTDDKRGVVYRVTWEGG